jgi:hypothetical protein
MTDTATSTANRLRILQINLNKSPNAHLDIINNVSYQEWDIILVQEPNITFFTNIRTPNHYVSVTPGSRFTLQSPVRSVIWISSKITTNSWRIINIPDTNDISAVQLTGNFGRLTIFNIYNEGNSNDTLIRLHAFMEANRQQLCTNENDYIMWNGDFNRHHPLWDDDEDIRLFTNGALVEANFLINRLADWNLVMALPKGIPTLKHMVTKMYSRPDNVFCTDNLTDYIVKCDTLAALQPPKTDHFPIVTVLSLPSEHIKNKESPNFRAVDWKEFNEKLAVELTNIDPPQPITTKEQLSDAIAGLTKAIQSTIRAKVPVNRPCPHSKRWWNSDLKDAKRHVSKLSNISYKYRALPDHESHSQYREARNKYAEAIAKAKTDHWTSYLEEATEEQLWTANRYLTEPVGDGGRTRIPTLKVGTINGSTVDAYTNEEKANALVKTFFPARPAEDTAPENYVYPEPVQYSPVYTTERIRNRISKLSPYKASGPDEIPNIVLQKSVGQISDHLSYIFQAIIALNTYNSTWQEFTTAVLRKPGKPSYEVPKAYRPIALICTMAKVLTGLIAEDVVYMTEKHKLLPDMHFGGRPGRMTTDAIHVLVDKIKNAWRR